jgi:hypothetical protein
MTADPGTSGVLRVANCSGFFGDRLSAAREMVDGGPIDVLTGDWLAELTMVVLHKTRARHGGYARTFLRQLEEVLPRCLERGIRVVSNAGGLDPERCADDVRELARRQGVAVRVAAVSGDDLVPRFESLRHQGERFTHLDTGDALAPDAALLTANAYLGGAPVAAALGAGADVVVTGRVTDASLVVGPAMHAFGWGPDDLDAVAGAVVAGHVIECGAQCCGGNYAFFDEVPGSARIGFPVAELSADGSSVITKHPGTGGMVSVGTVTAQLLYEIGAPAYQSPDAVARFDTIALAQEGPDRVRISGVRGEPPPDTLKVAANLVGGWRNSMTLVLTGAHAPEKAAMAEAAVWAAVPGGRDQYAETAAALSGDRSGEGLAYLRLAVRGEDEGAVGRAFSSALVETSLATYPGAFSSTPPSGAQEVARYWPTTVGVDRVPAVVTLEGRPVEVAPWRPSPPPTTVAAPDVGPGAAGALAGADHDGGVRVPLGVLVGARSGDKGGNANIGLWADTDEVAAWLLGSFDAAALRAVLPEADGLAVTCHPLANLRAVNFVVVGLLGWGVAANLRLDTQAKGLGELVRSRAVTVPAALVAQGPPAERLARWH